MQRQMNMVLDDCARCGQTIKPGEQVVQTAWVDIIDGRIVSSKPETRHLKDHCPREAQEDGR